jgi:hypothetical protein
LASIARDVQKESSMHDEAWVETMFNGLADALKGKGPPMAITQWMSWLKASDYWDPLFHRRLFMLLLWGLQLGFVKGSISTGSLKIEGLTKPMETHGVSSKKAKEKCAQQLRTSGKNQLHSVLILYQLGWILQRQIRKLMISTKPLQAFFRDQHKRQRSPADSLKFYIDCADGWPLQSLADTFGTLSDDHNLRYLGLCTCASDLPLVMTDDRKFGIIADERDFLQGCMRFQFCLVGNRLRSLLWNLEGLPGDTYQPQIPPVS